MKSRLQRSLFDPDPDPPAEPRNPLLKNIAAVPTTQLSPRRAPEKGRAQRGSAACDVPVDTDWVAFLKERGRTPLISDDRKPWDYGGWLMYYRILIEDHCDIPKRWDYWFRTMMAGRLLDEPIPQMHFGCGEFGERSEGYKLIDQWVRLIDHYGQGWSSPMTVLLDWMLWGFGLSKEKPSVSEDLNEQLYHAVNLGPLLLHPHDYLGEWIALQKGNWNPNAFYPTPSHVVELMVQMNFAGVDPAKARALTVCDPCLGSARFLMQSSNYSLRLFGADIDLQLVKASQVNGALYIPWLVRPFPDEFFIGDEHADALDKATASSTENPS